MISLPYFTLIFGLRIVIWFVGIFGLPLLIKPLYGDRRHIAAAAQTSLWKSYVEMAWRNPTNGMKGWFKQPVPEKQPNPDRLVRVLCEGNYHWWPVKFASRWMKDGLYWEYWYLRSIDWKIFGKHYRWFEFRIGWKFVDGNDEFFPTIQFGPRSS